MFVAEKFIAPVPGDVHHTNYGTPGICARCGIAYKNALDWVRLDLQSVVVQMRVSQPWVTMRLPAGVWGELICSQCMWAIMVGGGRVFLDPDC